MHKYDDMLGEIIMFLIAFLDMMSNKKPKRLLLGFAD